MKCPKCGYLGFERVDRCRNCGYDFPSAEHRLPELPLRERNSETSASDEPVDLPLFGNTVPADSTPPPRSLPARPPLAVRRATPEVPRARVDQPRTPMLDLEPDEPRTQVAARTVAASSSEAAGLPTRFVAALIDVLLLTAIDLAVVYFTLQIGGLTFDQIGLVPKVPLLAFLVTLDGGYLIAFTAGGQTLGKMATGIRVVPIEGADRLELGQSILRAAIWALLALPAGLGFVTALLDGDHRGLHDRFARTRVIRANPA